MTHAKGEENSTHSQPREPVYPTAARADRALILVEGFREVYKAALKKKGGRRNRAHNLIWTSIREKKRAVTKQAPESSNESEVESADDWDSDSGKEKPRSSASKSIAEEFRKRKLKQDREKMKKRRVDIGKRTQSRVEDTNSEFSDI